MIFFVNIFQCGFRVFSVLQKISCGFQCHKMGHFLSCVLFICLFFFHFKSGNFSLYHHPASFIPPPQSKIKGKHKTKRNKKKTTNFIAHRFHTVQALSSKNAYCATNSISQDIQVWCRCAFCILELRMGVLKTVLLKSILGV